MTTNPALKRKKINCTVFQIRCAAFIAEHIIHAKLLAKHPLQKVLAEAAENGSYRPIQNFFSPQSCLLASVCGQVCLQDGIINHNGKYLPSCRGFDSEAAVLKHLDLIRSY